MKERPIIFSAEIVRAILDGRKTQTRRVLKVQPSDEVGEFLVGLRPCRRNKYEFMGDLEMGHEVGIKPYAFIGDHLWVRENWWKIPIPTDKELREGADTWPAVTYPATDDDPEYREWGWIKKPSIHMPRWASRITLEITDIKVERLQNISDEDVLAEGFRMNTVSIFKLGYQGAFKKLWNSINGEKHPWTSNPWVWKISFREID